MRRLLGFFGQRVDRIRKHHAIRECLRNELPGVHEFAVVSRFLQFAKKLVDAIPDECCSASCSRAVGHSVPLSVTVVCPNPSADPRAVGKAILAQIVRYEQQR